MTRLAPSLQVTRDSVILNLVELEKQVREGKIRGFFQIPKFVEDPELCPVYALFTYFTKVKSAKFELLILLTVSLQVFNICEDTKLFIVSYAKPHRSVRAQTLARWIKCVLTTAGVDRSIWAPHSVRAASSAHLSVAKNLDLGAP